MQIDKINNNCFKSKVRIYENVFNHYKKGGKEDILKKYVRSLEKNGINDFFIVSDCINQKKHQFLSADVYTIEKDELYVGKSIYKEYKDEDNIDLYPNLEDLYTEAKAEKHSISNGIFQY